MSRRGRQQRNGYCKWTEQEVEVIYACLGDAALMGAHAAFACGQFPDELRVTAVEGSTFGQLCDAIAQRLLDEAGETNQGQARPLHSIAAKITAMREHALATLPDVASADAPAASSASLYLAFDMEAFHEQPRTVQRPNASDEFLPADAEVYVPPTRSEAHITFQTRILNRYISCRLCHGYLQEACTIIECLHTFCKTCIARHFQGSSECPTCKKALGVNPADGVRNDRTLQSIVDKVFPHYANEPANRESQESLKQSDEIEPAAKRARPPTEPLQLSFELVEEAGTLLPLRLERPFLRTDASMTVAHVRKHLARKAGSELSEGMVLQLFCHEQLLRPECALGKAYRECWNNPLKDMVLTFRVAKDEPKKKEGVAMGVAPAAAPDGAEGGEDAGEVGAPPIPAVAAGLAQGYGL
ncbi:hypothetical protein T492DRAFT_1081416 [Pavlovales sp. CCMP2436]|nr:hypothetical protein T492DRAFT_1081416 [Pavlovales sp. CCMP2436]